MQLSVHQTVITSGFGAKAAVDESIFSELVEFVNGKGFNTANLIKTIQV